jgi:hypothetical protein
VNLYGFVQNSVINKWDLWGLLFQHPDPTKDIMGNPRISEPGLLDQLNPWGTRGQFGTEDYRAYFERRFPKAVGGAIGLMIQRIQSWLFANCKNKKHPDIVPGHEIDTVEMRQSGTRFGDSQQNWHEREIQIGAFLFKVADSTVFWSNKNPNKEKFYFFKSLMFVEEQTGANRLDDNPSRLDKLLYPTRLFDKRYVIMGVWDLYGQGICPCKKL